MPVNDLNQPKHLLIMRLSAIGDVAMTVPIVLAIKQQYPKIKITVVSRPLFESFFSSIPDVTFFSADFENSKSGVLDLFKLYKSLAKHNIDAFADLHNVLRSMVVGTFFKLSGVSVIKVDKGRPERKKLTALANKKLRPIKSMFERHADVCKQLNIPIDLSKVKLLDKRNLSPKVLELTGSKESKWIGFAPFATYNTKMYPLELTKEVIKKARAKDYKLFLFGGGAKEVKLLQQIESSFDNCINIAGKLSFAKELELISHLDLMVSMDSGNGHMAAMFGVSVITLWGNTHPYAGFVPFNQPISNSIVPDLKAYPYIPTSIYGNKVIENYEDCMKTISPDTVIEKINEVLGR